MAIIILFSVLVNIKSKILTNNGGKSAAVHFFTGGA